MDLWDILAAPNLADSFSYEETEEILRSVQKLHKNRAEPTLIDLNLKASADPNVKPSLIILGDTHGDFLTTKSAVEEFFFERPVTADIKIEPPPGRYILFTGDYIDRAPRHIENGSFINIMYVLSLKALFPDRVTLLRGNHEAFEVIPCSPFNFPDDLVGKFGQYGHKMLNEFKAVFRQLPLMLRTSNGLFAAHGGVFRGPGQPEDLKKLDPDKKDHIGPPTWGEPDEHCAPRPGAGGEFNFSKSDFGKFMTAIGASVMVRGHSPDLVGRSIYGGRCLTLFTTEAYLRHLGDRCSGTVTVQLDRQLDRISDLQLYFHSRGNWLPVKAAPMEKNNKD